MLPDQQKQSQMMSQLFAAVAGGTFNKLDRLHGRMATAEGLTAHAGAVKVRMGA
ncbi:MAG: hypothetical protein WC612_08690 [Bdellovibrionales bacterium]|jgi:histidinol dehydrogenase